MNWFGKYNRNSKINELLNSPIVNELSSISIPSELIHILFVPHAGIEYSGVCASIAYKTILHRQFNNIILLCTDHSNSPKLKLMDKSSFELNNFGNFKINQEIVQKLISSELTLINNDAFNKEHSFFIQLPYIKQLDFNSIVPILCGKTEKSIVNLILSVLKQNDLLICTSDLSHINGNFPTKMNTNNLINHDSQTILYLIGENKVIQSNNSICGLPVLRFLHECYIKNKHLIPRVVCYYNSQFNQDLILKSNPFDFVNKVNSDSFNPNNSTVSYLSIVYSNINYLDNNLKSIVTPFEKWNLLTFARASIAKKSTKLLACPIFIKNVDLFITIYESGNKNKLFGCVGDLNTNKVIIQNVAELSYKAAYNDPRFGNQISTYFSIDITFLSPLKPISLEEYWNDSVYIKGLHGIYLTLNNQSAYFLPSVLVEQIPNKNEQLKLLCNKANFESNCYENAKLEYNLGFTISDS